MKTLAVGEIESTDQVYLYPVRNPWCADEDGSQFQFVLKGRTDDPPKRFEIIYYQYTD
jgi:hypothetical protein